MTDNDINEAIKLIEELKDALKDNCPMRAFTNPELIRKEQNLITKANQNVDT